MDESLSPIVLYGETQKNTQWHIINIIEWQQYKCVNRRSERVNETFLLERVKISYIPNAIRNVFYISNANKFGGVHIRLTNMKQLKGIFKQLLGYNFLCICVCERMNVCVTPDTTFCIVFLRDADHFEHFNSSSPGQNGPPFCRRCFQKHFSERKVLYFE